MQQVTDEVICKGQLYRLMSDLSEQYTPEVAWTAFEAVYDEHQAYVGGNDGGNGR